MKDSMKSLKKQVVRCFHWNRYCLKNILFHTFLWLQNVRGQLDLGQSNQGEDIMRTLLIAATLLDQCHEQGVHGIPLVQMSAQFFFSFASELLLEPALYSAELLRIPEDKFFWNSMVFPVLNSGFLNFCKAVHVSSIRFLSHSLLYGAYMSLFMSMPSPAQALLVSVKTS